MKIKKVLIFCIFFTLHFSLLFVYSAMSILLSSLHLTHWHFKCHFLWLSKWGWMACSVRCLSSLLARLCVVKENGKVWWFWLDRGCWDADRRGLGVKIYENWRNFRKNYVNLINFLQLLPPLPLSSHESQFPSVSFTFTFLFLIFWLSRR